MLVVLIVLSLGLMLLMARRRLWLGMKMAAGAFVVLNLYRFALASDNTDRFILLGLALAAFGAVWVVLWAITRLVERRRALHPAPPRPPQRRPRWRL
jgi:hypothetical protein